METAVAIERGGVLLQRLAFHEFQHEVRPAIRGFAAIDQPCDIRMLERRQQLPADDSGMQMAEARPVEGRSLRAAGNEARLGPTLSSMDSTTLLRTLLPRAPIDTVDVSGTPGVAVTAAMLDTAYQLK